MVYLTVPVPCEVFESIDEDFFLKNLTLFYLKLQAKLLLPSSVIQTIIEEVQGIYYIKVTLNALFESEDFKSQYELSHSRPPNKDVFEDIWDGHNIASNASFKADKSSMALILYQDVFEVVNPLGSIRKKKQDFGSIFDTW